MKPQRKKFSVSERVKSFRFAFKGIVHILESQHNFWIHLTASVLVIFAGWYFNVSTQEWCLLILCIGGVFAAEAFNTAVEFLVDLVSPGYHELAAKAKDSSAAGVLLISLAAAIVGILIFLPKILKL